MSDSDRTSRTWVKPAAGAALLWCTGAIAAYYTVHQPLHEGQIRSLADLLLTLMLWVGSIGHTHAVGSLLLKRREGLSEQVLTAMRIGLGFFFLSLLLLGLGALGLYRTWLFWLLFLLPTPWSLPPFLRSVPGLFPPCHTRFDNALRFFLAFAIGLAFLRALLPPTAWDSLVYHLTGPALYRRAGALVHDVDLAYLGFPQAGSMLFLWGIMLAGPELAQLFHFTFMLLTLLLTAELAERAAPGKGWLASALLLSAPTSWLLSSWAYVEWMGMFAGVAALLCIVRLGHSQDAGENPRLALCAGLFVAFAFGAKYTTAGLLLGLLLAFVLARRSLRMTAIFLGAMALGILPFLLKNWFLTGNPAYPFFFDGLYWDDARRFWYGRFGTGLGVLDLILAPVHATVFGVEGGAVSGFPSYGASIGPLFLALIPLNIFGRPHVSGQRQALAATTIVAGAGYLLWLVQMGTSALLVQTRLLMPVFPMLAVLAAAGFRALERFWDWGRSAAFILSGLMLFVFGVTAFGYLSETVRDRSLGVVMGEIPDETYRLQELGAYVIAMDQINQLDDGAVIRFLWEPRSYDCREDIVCEPDALLDRWWYARRAGLGAEAVIETWSAEGVTHVLLFRDGMAAARDAGYDPFEAEDWIQLERFTEELLQPVWTDLEGYGLYALGRSQTE